MDRVAKYAELVKQVLTDYANFGSGRTNIDRQLIFDDRHHHYQIVNIGWDDQRRIYGCVVHIDIQNEKIWLQYNGTEVDFAEELVALGVPKQDIVIGFITPFMRQVSDYAVS